MEPIYVMRFSNLEVEDYIKRLSELLLSGGTPEFQARIRNLKRALDTYRWKTFTDLLNLTVQDPYLADVRGMKKAMIPAGLSSDLK